MNTPIHSAFTSISFSKLTKELTGGEGSRFLASAIEWNRPSLLASASADSRQEFTVTLSSKICFFHLHKGTGVLSQLMCSVPKKTQFSVFQTDTR